ncbi:MAG: hypothetical protein ABI443_04555 [Chthoniobacterales bacterium]
MNDYEWSAEFLKIYENAVKRYREGAKAPETVLITEEIKWLALIGCRPREFFDFVEDYARGGEPDPGTALLLAAQRRSYFLEIQNGRWEKSLPSSTLPPKSEEVRGIRWLPRLIEKAKRKLRGQMDDDLMYGCGGDRGFCRQFHIHLSDFLKRVEEANGDDAQVIDFMVKRGERVKSS